MTNLNWLKLVLVEKDNYPKKRTWKQYMIFEIEALDDYAEDLQRNHLIENLIVNIPDYVKGTPVFLEP